MTLSVALTLCTMSCGESEKEAKATGMTAMPLIGKYLYKTTDNVLHCNENCLKMRFAVDEQGREVNGKTFVDTLEIVSDEGLSYCVDCFDDSLYERVQEMIMRNAPVEGAVEEVVENKDIVMEAFMKAFEDY